MHRTRLLQRCKTIAFQQTPQAWRWQRLCWNYANIPNRKQTKSRSHATSPRHIFQKTFEHFTRICFQCHGFVWVTCFCEMIDQFFGWSNSGPNLSAGRPTNLHERFERSGRSLFEDTFQPVWLCQKRVDGFAWCASHMEITFDLEWNDAPFLMGMPLWPYLAIPYLAICTKHTFPREEARIEWLSKKNEKKPRGRLPVPTCRAPINSKLHVDPYQRKITRPNWLMFRHLSTFTQLNVAALHCVGTWRPSTPMKSIDKLELAYDVVQKKHSATRICFFRPHSHHPPKDGNFVYWPQLCQAPPDTGLAPCTPNPCTLPPGWHRRGSFHMRPGLWSPLLLMVLGKGVAFRRSCRCSCSL